MSEAASRSSIHCDDRFGTLTFTFGTYANLDNFPDMFPVPTGSIYGRFKSKQTLKGQNTAPPSQKFFKHHAMLKVLDSGIYYDPSYGSKHNSLKICQDNAMLGYTTLVIAQGVRITNMEVTSFPDALSLWEEERRLGYPPIPQ